MTKSEKLTLTTMTAKAWLALHKESYENASCATSWAHYQELNSNKYTHGLRCEWASLYELCTALRIDMNNDAELDLSVAAIMHECVELSSATWAIYKEFSDYPFRNTSATETDATNQNEEEEA